MSARIRPATANDAGAIVQLSSEFAEFVHALGDPTLNGITVDQYLRDGFGLNPAFAGFVAEVDGEVIGYLLYCPGYDLDRGGRIVHVVDLYVREGARRQGIGRALMEAAADACRKMGAHQLFWAVYDPNDAAFAFYERLGAKRTKDLTFMHWDVDGV